RAASIPIRCASYTRVAKCAHLFRWHGLTYPLIRLHRLDKSISPGGRVQTQGQCLGRIMTASRRKRRRVRLLYFIEAEKSCTVTVNAARLEWSVEATTPYAAVDGERGLDCFECVAHSINLYLSFSDTAPIRRRPLRRCPGERKYLFVRRT